MSLNLNMMRTPNGVPFAVLGDLPAKPAPTLLLLAGAIHDSLDTEPYSRTGQLLGEKGWQVFSLDLPCHGDDRRPGEPEGLAGWRARIEAGEDIVAEFSHRAEDAIEHLVKTGAADWNRLAVAGTSRGGFMALHAAAAIPAIRAVAALAPVTDLLTLREFTGMQRDPLTNRLPLTNRASALADRAVWITIGCADERVGTEKAIAFARALAAAAAELKREPKVTLHVFPVPGHTSLPEWHDLAAEWTADEMSLEDT